MVVIGSSFLIVPDRHPALGEAGPELVVWLRGQHDVWTESALCMTLARAIAVRHLVWHPGQVGYLRRSTKHCDWTSATGSAFASSPQVPWTGGEGFGW